MMLYGCIFLRSNMFFKKVSFCLFFCLFAEKNYGGNQWLNFSSLFFQREDFQMIGRRESIFHNEEIFQKQMNKATDDIKKKIPEEAPLFIKILHASKYDKNIKNFYFLHVLIKGIHIIIEDFTDQQRDFMIKEAKEFYNKDFINLLKNNKKYKKILNSTANDQEKDSKKKKFFFEKHVNFSRIFEMYSKQNQEEYNSYSLLYKNIRDDFLSKFEREDKIFFLSCYEKNAEFLFSSSVKSKIPSLVNFPLTINFIDMANKKFQNNDFEKTVIASQDETFHFDEENIDNFSCMCSNVDSSKEFYHENKIYHMFKFFFKHEKFCGKFINYQDFINEFSDNEEPNNENILNNLTSFYFYSIFGKPLDILCAEQHNLDACGKEIKNKKSLSELSTSTENSVSNLQENLTFPLEDEVHSVVSNLSSNEDSQEEDSDSDNSDESLSLNSSDWESEYFNTEEKCKSCECGELSSWQINFLKTIEKDPQKKNKIIKKEIQKLHQEYMSIKLCEKYTDIDSEIFEKIIKNIRPKYPILLRKLIKFDYKIRRFFLSMTNFILGIQYVDLNFLEKINFHHTTEHKEFKNLLKNEYLLSNQKTFVFDYNDPYYKIFFMNYAKFLDIDYNLMLVEKNSKTFLPHRELDDIVMQDIRVEFFKKILQGEI